MCLLAQLLLLVELVASFGSATLRGAHQAHSGQAGDASLAFCFSGAHGAWTLAV
jgi:hypothetical protein